MKHTFLVVKGRHCLRKSRKPHSILTGDKCHLRKLRQGRRIGSVSGSEKICHFKYGFLKALTGKVTLREVRIEPKMSWRERALR